MDWGRAAWRGARLLAAMVAVCVLGCAEPRPSGPRSTPEAPVVLVHGAWAGGWHFRKVEPLLRAAGHQVYRPTLTGLGERVHLAGPGVDLSTHVEDIVKVLEFEALDEVVLVGHSYGGMVIAGVAERVPERIGLLVFVDALLPEDGESVMSLAGERVSQMARLEGPDGQRWKLVPMWVEEGEPPPVDVPQPLATFTEPIRLGNPDADRLPGAYILTVEAGADSDPFAPFAGRARMRGWSVVEMEGGHNPHWFQPEALSRILLNTIAAHEKGETG
jgi:pimeloyl-ACP methyl ester carboxylesterase